MLVPSALLATTVAEVKSMPTPMMLEGSTPAFWIASGTAVRSTSM